MTASRYCSDCGENWPNEVRYVKCPGCNDRTTVVPGMAPMGPNGARQRAHDLTLRRTRHEEFEKFCAERDAPIIEAEAAKFRAELDKFVGVDA